MALDSLGSLLDDFEFWYVPHFHFWLVLALPITNPKILVSQLVIWAIFWGNLAFLRPLPLVVSRFLRCLARLWLTLTALKSLFGIELTWWWEPVWQGRLQIAAIVHWQVIFNVAQWVVDSSSKGLSLPAGQVFLPLYYRIYTFLPLEPRGKS